MERLVHDSSVYGIRLSAEQSGQLERYLSLLTEWSGRVNLVGNVDPETVLSRHFLESIALGAALREREILRPGSTVLDVGSGAGFPGAVLKIAWPAIEITLLDATARKTEFLSALVAELGLTGVRVLTGRAETLAHDPGLRARFDLVVSRAVAPLPALLELTLPFARVGGRAVCVKGSRATAEVEAAKGALERLGGTAFVVPFHVPGPAQSLIAVVKKRETPLQYPRRPGMPAKSPL